MSPGRDTDPEGILATATQEAKKHTPKLVAAGMFLLMSLFGYWTYRITAATMEAKDAAENAEAKGERGEVVAKKVKVENQAGYAATAEKVDTAGDTLVAALARIAELEAKVERLEAARAGRRPRRVRPVKPPPVLNTDLPPTPAAAAAEQTAQP